MFAIHIPATIAVTMVAAATLLLQGCSIGWAPPPDTPEVGTTSGRSRCAPTTKKNPSVNFGSSCQNLCQTLSSMTTFSGLSIPNDARAVVSDTSEHSTHVLLTIAPEADPYTRIVRTDDSVELVFDSARFETSGLSRAEKDCVWAAGLSLQAYVTNGALQTVKVGSAANVAMLSLSESATLDAAENAFIEVAQGSVRDLTVNAAPSSRWDFGRLSTETAQLYMQSSSKLESLHVTGALDVSLHPSASVSIVANSSVEISGICDESSTLSVNGGGDKSLVSGPCNPSTSVAAV